jgi:uncharacterized lipoprotein YddW (UPF0748 family)
MKRTRGYLRAMAVMAVSAAALSPATSELVTPIRGIWISPPSSSAVIPSVVRIISRAPLDTIVLPVFYDGRVVYPSRIFPQHEAYMGSDPAAITINEAHARQIKVFAAVDVLYWQSSNDPSPAVANHPRWLERTAEGRVIGDAPGAPGAFVTPCEPRVRSLLSDLMSEMAQHYDFDGVVLDYGRWSGLDFLGYADADRRLYLQEQRIDPLDIDLLGYATPDNLISTLIRWQERQITGVVQAAAQAFKQGEPKAVVLAVVEPTYYANRTTNSVRQDWRGWLSQQWLDAAVPQGLAYPDQESVRAQLRAASGTERPPVVALIRRSAALPATPQMAVVQGLGLRGFILWGHDSLDQRRAILRELGAF